jgi:ribonuclease R
MVTVRDLSAYDDFRLDEADYALVGLRTGQKFRMGDPVRIKVVAANLSKRQLDFEWVTEKKANASKGKAPVAGKSKQKPVDKVSGKKKK